MSRMLVENPKGLPVVDATEDVCIKVSVDDVRKAKPMSPTDCAIARGCHRAVKGLVQATINKAVSYLTYKDRIERYTTTEAAVRELVAFDRNAPFAPGEYWLKAPCKSMRLDREQKRDKHTSKDGSKGPNRTGRHVTVMVRGA